MRNTGSQRRAIDGSCGDVETTGVLPKFHRAGVGAVRRSGADEARPCDATGVEQSGGPGGDVREIPTRKITVIHGSAGEILSGDRPIHTLRAGMEQPRLTNGKSAH